MEDILAAFPDRETFDRYWEENYVPVTYEAVSYTHMTLPTIA